MVTQPSLERLRGLRGRLENEVITERSKTGIESAISYVALSIACQAEVEGLLNAMANN
ncbi:hypothetical protein H7J83_23740 [Mycobacterium mantenii]|uniref:hypothetical protein n=1 Tax=Mycobacterium mantenii TaxID=560555 RepID=UPI001301FA4E|nr:hypothetical protein [Mycobacterium mantenii]MCV7245699.1 hypothetical protein [Mycobacterium mantenii]